MAIDLSWCTNFTSNLSIYLIRYHCSKVEINITSCKPIQTSQEMDDIENYCKASETIWNCLFWFSVVVGIIGNSIAFFTVASLPVSIATFYIGVLSCSDFTAIVIRLASYFLKREGLMMTSKFLFNVLPMLFDFCVYYSNWLLVLICLDRFVSIRFPLKRRFYFTIRHAQVSAFFLAVILFSINLTIEQTLGYADTRMFTLRNLLYSFIPLAFIVIFIVLIALQFRSIHIKRKLLLEGMEGGNSNHHKVSRKLASSGRFSSSTNPSPNSSSSQTRGLTNSTRKSTRSNVLDDVERLENSITAMMLLTAIVFAILTVPNCVLMFTFQHAARKWNTPLAKAHWHLLSRTSQGLTFLNLAINFFLYFLSASKFRKQLAFLIRRRRRKNRYDSSANTSIHNHVTSYPPTTHDSETFL